MRRTITFILTLLAIGAIINAAVTWGCSKWSVAWECDWRWSGVTDRSIPCFYAIAWTNAGTVRLHAISSLEEQTFQAAVGSSSIPWLDDYDPVEESIRQLRPAQELIQQLDLSAAPTDPDRLRFIDAQGWGWPLLSVYGAQLHALSHDDPLIVYRFNGTSSWPEWERVSTMDANAPFIPPQASPPIRGILVLGTTTNSALYALIVAALYGWVRLLAKSWRSSASSRRTYRLVVPLVLGVLSTVAVTWCCSLWVDPLHAYDGFGVRPRSGASEMSEGIDNQYQNWLLNEFTAFGAKMVYSTWEDPGRGSFGSGGSPKDPPQAVMPWWWGGTLAPPTESTTIRHHHVRFGDAWGWPFLAIWSEARWDGTAIRQGVNEYRGGLRLTDRPISEPGGWLNHDRALPLRVIWPGFLLNVFIYWWAWLTLWIGFASLKQLRAWRRRRNRKCVRCAYDLRSINADRCPECGEPIPSTTMSKAIGSSAVANR